MPKRPSPVVNQADVPEQFTPKGEHWGAAWKPLTPLLDATPGRLGANLNRVGPGRTVCPFHTHQLEDELFYVLSGRGVLRYGEELHELRPGDCVSCPAGTGVAHQIVNPYDEDLVYLAVGRNDPNEVCTYPDTGKVWLRALKTVGRLSKTEYLDGEPDVPRILELVTKR